MMYMYTYTYIAMVCTLLSPREPASCHCPMLARSLAPHHVIVAWLEQSSMMVKELNITSKQGIHIYSIYLQYKHITMFQLLVCSIIFVPYDNLLIYDISYILYIYIYIYILSYICCIQYRIECRAIDRYIISTVTHCIHSRSL